LIALSVALLIATVTVGAVRGWRWWGSVLYVVDPRDSYDNPAYVRFDDPHTAKSILSQLINIALQRLLLMEENCGEFQSM
jgi:hypothetical protein